MVVSGSHCSQSQIARLASTPQDLLIVGCNWYGIGRKKLTVLCATLEEEACSLHVPGLIVTAQ